MNARHGTVATLALALAAGGVHAGTCTIEGAGLRSINHIGSVGDLLSPVPSANGYDIEVDVDEAAGTFIVRREAMPPFEFGSPGGNVALRLAGPVVAGRIDAKGHVRLGPWSLEADFAGIPLPQSPVFSTGIKSNQQFDKEFPSVGAALDFTTGILTLDGNAKIASAPIISEPVATNYKITCRLAPIPNAAALPAGASLVKPRGTAKVKGAPEGDSLVLTAKLVPPAEGLDIAGRDVVVQIGDTPETALLFSVAHADVLGAKGKKRLVKDAGGASLRVLKGRKGTDETPVPTSGSLVVTPGKKSIALKLTLKGLDLAALSGTQQVTVGIGDVSASAPVTVAGSGKKRKLK
ncbi:MAG: hypothetical protein KIT14_16340 [bacterium]|nr:hypothetical protein [bacterium]